MGELEILGSRRRYAIETTGTRQTLVVRRMRCLHLFHNQKQKKFMSYSLITHFY
ncbi:hypothetical protein [Proteiniclasticum ruminis]|uniref:hypothetical protein n=1 Tax=Proteiniclasticum ruminis TaxID=398199 RepID=UPI0035E40DD3